MKTLPTIILTIGFAILTSCATSSPRTISYDTSKVSLDRVIAVVTNVFNSHGYKTTLGGPTVSRVQDGKTLGTFTDTTEPIISTDKQPPIAGINSTEWFYSADVKAGTVELSVNEKLPKPINVFGTVIVYGPTTEWEPRDLKEIQSEIQNQLSR